MALDYILGVPGSFSGNKFRKENDEYLRRILHLTPAREHADKVAMILFNLIGTELGCSAVLKVAERNEDCGLNKIVELQETKDFILEKDCCVIQRPLSFPTYDASLTKRGGIVGAIKDCCFETEGFVASLLTGVLVFDAAEIAQLGERQTEDLKVPRNEFFSLLDFLASSSKPRKGAKESVVISFRFLKESLQTYKERKSETQLHEEDLQ
ncbi:Protein HGH1-like protein [Acropora cervicornis]|uniref:Protein HGH1-like protein n=1 Tax=Acropora cervicornis TaxID=6130 RepID=A0AAD9VHB6_ACRCE|nr:Protein HGH1-like protein [Acropora cervicornis]